MPDRPDLLTQLERYGTVLEVDRAEPPAVAPHASVLHPHRRPWGRAALAAAAAIVLLAGALVLTRGGGAVSTSPLGDGVTTEVEPSGPATSPRLVAGHLPAGLVPTAAYEGENEPGVLVLGHQPDPGPVRQTRPTTTSVFTVARGSGPTWSVRVEVNNDQANWPADPVTVRGVDGDQFTENGLRVLVWRPATATVRASATDAVPATDLRAMVEALRARSAEPYDGFDAPGEPVNGWTVSLTAERVMSRGDAATQVKGSSRAWYRDPAHPDRMAVVEGNAAGTGETTALLTTVSGGELRVIAGQERLVGPAGPTAGATVAWVRADGTVAVVQTRGLAATEIESLVAGVSAADPVTWDRLRTQVGDVLRAEHVVGSADLPVGRVEIYGEEGGAYGSMRGACLTVPGGAPRCSAIAPPADRSVSYPVRGTNGGYSMPTYDSGQFVASLVVGRRWFAIGGIRHLRLLDVEVNSRSVPLRSAPGGDDLLLFAAELPKTAQEAGIHLAAIGPPNGQPGMAASSQTRATTLLVVRP
jgi:hypothetical protein